MYYLLQNKFEEGPKADISVFRVFVTMLQDQRYYYHRFKY